MPYSTRPAEERAKEIEQKISQLEARKKAILARDKEAARKARTKRLIEIGAEVEAALGVTLDSPDQRAALGRHLRIQQAHGGIKGVTRPATDGERKL